MAYVPKTTKMSFSVEELAKSSNAIDSDQITCFYGSTSKPLTVTDPNTHRKRKRSDDSFNSSFNSSADSDSDFKEQPTKKSRTTFTNSQIMELEKYYSSQRYLRVEDRPLLAKRLKLSQTQIKWWFQNRRMKEKRQIKSYCNGVVDMSQFAAHRLHSNTGIQQHQQLVSYSQHQYPAPVPMFQQMTPYMYGQVFPAMHPSYTQQFYSSFSPQPVYPSMF